MSSASSVLKNSLKSIDLLILLALGLSTLFPPKLTGESMQPAPDVRVLMFDSPTVVDVGSSLTYIIDVTNIGDLPATGVTLTDLGPMRAARRTPLLALGLADRRSGWPLEMVLRAHRAGWRVTEVPIPYSPRIGRSKVTGTVRGTVQAVRDMRRVLAS